MAAVFAENADAYNPHGRHAVGRAEIEKMFTEEQTGSGPLRESTLEVKDEPFGLITADVAITDAAAVVSNAIGPDGKKMAPLHVRVTNVWKKVGDSWLVFASRPCFITTPAH